MKQVILQGKDYCIYKVDVSYVRKISEFVVRTNYMHHISSINQVILEEIESIYKDEICLSQSSQFYIAEDFNNKIIGCIRVLKWDKENVLPIEKIVGINPLELIAAQESSTIWHVGRFAVNSCNSSQAILLFKQLMIYAITPICQDECSYMLAECDSKLLRVMGFLGINTVNLMEGINYLGSETIPIVVNTQGLITFYNSFKHLCTRINDYNKKPEVA